MYIYIYIYISDPYQVLPLRARADLGAMTVKRYSSFPKAPALLEPHHQIFSAISRPLICVWVFPLSREAVGLFYSPISEGKCVCVCVCVFAKVFLTTVSSGVRLCV